MKTPDEQEPTKIYVLSKVNFQNLLIYNNISDENVSDFKNYAFICINDSCGSYYHTPLFNSIHHNVINFFFDDVETNFELSSNNNEETKLFTESDAKKTIEFLEHNKQIKALFIHCAGGTSRSGALGTFALDYLHGDKQDFKTTNSMIVPNAKVLRILNKTYREI
jgi:predicted protein tyrosine phosphatase